ncbi:D-alanyl-D-alanine endopeptidase [Pasteurellaceae bacterium Macca]|nr:D-alanyl-D-alanine endopeptidase [Pasteurellaceae bacterium Macca]
MLNRFLFFFLLLPNFVFASTSYVVYDFSNNQVLENQLSNTVRPIASVTKLMTANVFLESNANKSCRIAISSEDTDLIKGTWTTLPRNVPIACSELLKAMMVHSDNYAAHALSRAAGMSRATFIQKMNEKARELGMYSTHFKDSSGLSKENVSTAMDLVKLAKYSLKKPILRNLSNTRKTWIRAGNKNIFMRNTNYLVREKLFEAALNKTGYIQESGYNLVFVNKNRCGNRLIGVVSLNNSSSNARATLTSKKLKSYGCS